MFLPLIFHTNTQKTFLCLKMIMAKIIYLLAHYYTKGYLLSQTHKAVFRNRIEKSVSLIIKTSKVQEDGRPFFRYKCKYCSIWQKFHRCAKWAYRWLNRIKETCFVVARAPVLDYFVSMFHIHFFCVLFIKELHFMWECI